VRPTKRNQIIVLTCALVSSALGLFVAPLASSGTASWIAVAIGVLLVGQWVLMTRADRAGR
jgi:hypothetical protein